MFWCIKKCTNEREMITQIKQGVRGESNYWKKLYNTMKYINWKVKTYEDVISVTKSYICKGCAGGNVQAFTQQNKSSVYLGLSQWLRYQPIVQYMNMKLIIFIDLNDTHCVFVRICRHESDCQPSHLLCVGRRSSPTAVLPSAWRLALFKRKI